MYLSEIIKLVEDADLDPEEVAIGYEGDVDNRWAVYGIDSARLDDKSVVLS